MPAKNITRTQLPESYYHVYARGNNKQLLFRDECDYHYFYNLICRYLSQEECLESNHVYPKYFDGINISAYCLMPNHFHILIYQKDIPYLEKFMRSLMTSYGMYLNLKYHQTGHVFESRYKAALIESDVYLMHISRYIHLNPEHWKRYPYSSLQFYKNANPPDWLDASKVISLFASLEEYLDFIADYKEMRDSLKEIKHLLLGKYKRNSLLCKRSALFWEDSDLT